MKFFLGLLVGVALGALGCNLYLKRNATPAPEFVEADPASRDNNDGARTFGERASDTTSDIRKNLTTKAQEWRLTPDDIKRELRDGGKVVREKAGVVGGKVSDVRIITVIKSKFVLDRDLSAMDITVECTHGHVVLSGEVPSVDHVAKAIAHAMDTDGVINVSAHLKSAAL